MKGILVSMLILTIFFRSSAQEDNVSALFQTNTKSAFYYVDLNNDSAFVYEMGRYLDKAGSGASIRKTDTLTKQPDGTYSGRSTNITRENNKYYLSTERKKSKRLGLDPVKDVSVINNDLNNAYYLDRYSRMCSELSKSYPLYHHSFRNGFYSWNHIPNKEMDYLLFRQFVDTRIGELKDSISQIQDRNVVLTNHIIENLKTLDYGSLKDSLVKLPAEYAYSSYYYGKVVNEVAKQKPEYFLQLAEDFPQNRNLIFSAAGDDKDVINKLKAVKGHDAIKKTFFKERKFSKSMPYKIVGMYAVIAGLIVLLISSQ